MCLKWFEQVAIPHILKLSVPGIPPVVIYDGHGSHATLEMRTMAREAGIILFCLPSHCTHHLQPLDVGIFGPLQRAYTKRVDNLTFEGMKVDKYNLIPLYMEARKEAFKTETIVSAFRKTGISPFNPNVFTTEDFAPSFPTSTVAHLPLTYPAADDLQTESSTNSSRVPLRTEENAADGEDDSDASSITTAESECSDDEENAMSSQSSFDIDLVSSDPTAPPTSDTNFDPPHSELLYEDEQSQSLTRSKAQSTRQSAHLLNILEKKNKDILDRDSQIRRLKAHAVLMARQNATLQKQANHKQQKSKRKELKTQARVLTHDDGIEAAQKEKDEQAAKAAEKEQRRFDQAQKRREKQLLDQQKKAELEQKRADAAARKEREEREKAERDAKRLERDAEALRKREAKEAKEAEKARKEVEKAAKAAEKAQKKADAEQKKVAAAQRKRSGTVTSRNTVPKRHRKQSTATMEVDQENIQPTNIPSAPPKPKPRPRPGKRKALTDLTENEVQTRGSSDHPSIGSSPNRPTDTPPHVAGPDSSLLVHEPTAPVVDPALLEEDRSRATDMWLAEALTEMSQQHNSTS